MDSSAEAERAACKSGPKRRGSAATRLRTIFRGPGRTFPSLRALLALHCFIKRRAAAQPLRVQIFGVRHWIKSALGEWAATAEPFQRQPRAVPCAVQFDRFL